MSRTHPLCRLALAAVCLLSLAAPVWADASCGSGSPQLTLEQPSYLQAAAPARPLMHLLNQARVGQPLSEAGFTLGGWVEGSATWGFDDPAGKVLAGRVFDFEHADPTLNQVVVFIERSVDPKKLDVGGRVEMMWGGDARVIHSNGLFDHYGLADGPDEQWDLTQAYLDLNIPVGRGLKVRAGKFVTTHGFETINPTTNAFYSHSYLFGFAIPFTHSGVLLSYPFSERFTLTAGVTRGWEQSLEDNNDAIDFLGSANWVISDRTSVVFNVSVGPQQAGDNGDWRYLFDVCFYHKLTDSLTLGLNGDVAWEENAALNGENAAWYGLAVYLSWVLNPVVTVNTRAEYFSDQSGARGLDTAVFEATVGLSITPAPNHPLLSGVKIRPEIRFDYAHDAIFDGGSSNTQWTAAIEAFVAF